MKTKVLSGKKEDIATVTKMNGIFFKTFKNIIPNLNVYQGVTFRDYLDYGADVIYTTKITLPQWNKRKKAGIKSNLIRGMLWVSSSINPNGISETDDIARAYTIHLEFKANKRVSQRRWEESIIIKFYDYARDIQTIIDLFQKWCDENFASLLRDINNKEYDWKKVY